jgi:transposase InsO family protein
LPVPTDKWEEVSMDFITGLPKSKEGHDAILVIVDRLSKWAYFIPTVTTADAKETARLFHDVVFSRHGMPKRLVSDRDSRFTSHFWRALFDTMGTTLGMSTAYHPQTDGQTERVNRVLEEALRAYVGALQTDWDLRLPSLQFAYNTAKHSSTGETPFYLNYGRHPIVPASLVAAPPAGAGVQRVPAAADFIQELRTSMGRATEALERSRQRYKQVADTRRQEQKYSVGDRVLLSTANLTLPRNLTRKLARLFDGPFKVKACIGDNAYELDLPASVQLHPVFNVSQLRPYEDPSARFPGRVVEPQPPVVVDGEEEYEVEAILAHREHRRRREYLVKWVGYPSLHNTWEPLTNLGNAMDVVESYKAAAGIAAVNRRTYVDVVRRSDAMDMGGPPPRIQGGNLSSTSTVADRSDLQRLKKKWRSGGAPPGCGRAPPHC